MFRKISAIVTVVVMIFYVTQTLKAVREAAENAKRDYRFARDAVASVVKDVLHDVRPPSNDGQKTTDVSSTKESASANATPVGMNPALEIAPPDSAGRTVADKIVLAECVDLQIGRWVSKGDCQVTWTKPSSDLGNTLVISLETGSTIGSSVQESAGARSGEISNRLYLRFPGISRIAVGGAVTPVLTCDAAGAPSVSTMP